MMVNHKKLIFQVHKLMQFNLDRIRGYKSATYLVHSSELQSLFEECMIQSEFFCNKLKAAMIFNGVQLHSKPSITGRLFLGWMHLQAFWGSNRNVAVLKSCLVAEKLLGKSYQFACDNPFLPYDYPLLKPTFINQRDLLQKAQHCIEHAIHLESGNLKGNYLEV